MPMSENDPTATKSWPDVRQSFANIQPYLIRSRFLGYWALVSNWGMIVGGLVLADWVAHPLAYVLCVLILANRQLGLAILMHDCSHYGLFPTRKEANFLGQWLCAAPVFADLERYRRYHLEHHRTAGTAGDPDRSNYSPYPVSAQSLVRKIARDLVGITGIKTLLLLWKMNSGQIAYQLSYARRPTAQTASSSTLIMTGLRNLRRSLIVHGILLALCLVLGRAHWYGLWWLAFISPYMVISRIRNAAEHAATPDMDSVNPLAHTRTTIARWWERLSFAPNYVNYHLEHHLWPSVPPYRLQALHQRLRADRLLEEADVCYGYGAVIRKLVRPQPRP